MELREFKPEDHPNIAQWWEGHGWSPIPLNILPKLGMIVSRDDIDVCAGWLYMDNSVGVCWLDWLVTNPEADPKSVIRCISQLVTFMSDRARDLNYGVMLTACRQPSLVRLYQRNGFNKTDTDVTHLMMVLTEE